MSSPGWASLSEAERRVVALLAQGLTNPQIAKRLYLSPWTVQTHVKKIFRKLGVGSRSEVAFQAAQHWDDLAPHS